MAEKAKIWVLEGTEKGEIEVMFNPSDYTVSSKIKASGEGANIQFSKQEMEEFTISLFYDTYEKGLDVRKETEKIVALQNPSVALSGTSRPPECLFVWGGFSYRGLVSYVEQRFTMFDVTGVPVRAEVTVKFKPSRVIEEEVRAAGKEACRKFWTVKSSDRLDFIAFNTLKDATQWRKIADLNKIYNPLIFPTEDDIGRILVIPD